MKDLSTINPVVGNFSHNKRSSQDRPKQQNINAIDTYNKLMQIMNEKVLKTSNAGFTGSRGKSSEKLSKNIP